MADAGISFRVQLRAILRASVLGSVQVMFPMIATLEELRRAKMVLADAMEDLDERGEPYDRQIAVGMMVEVPSSVVLIERFLREVDFISIGTNDLVQYTLAVDRANREVAELSAEPDQALLLLGLGLRKLSMPPQAIPEIKAVCRRVNIDDCRQIAQRALSFDLAREVNTYLQEQLRRLAGDAYEHN